MNQPEEKWRTVIVGLPIIRRLLNGEDVELEGFKINLIPDDVLFNAKPRPRPNLAAKIPESATPVQQYSKFCQHGEGVTCFRCKDLNAPPAESATPPPPKCICTTAIVDKFCPMSDAWHRAKLSQGVAPPAESATGETK